MYFFVLFSLTQEDLHAVNIQRVHKSVPWGTWPSGWDATLLVQGARVRELDPTCHNQRSHVLELRSRAAKLINFLKIITKSIYLLLAALGLRCREWACSSYGDGSYFLVVVHGLLLRVACLVAERGLQTHRLPYFGAQPHLLCGVWDSLLPKLFSLKRV